MNGRGSVMRIWEYRRRALAASQPEEAIEAILGTELGGREPIEGLDLLTEGLSQELGMQPFDLDDFMGDEDLDDDLEALNVFLDDDSDEDEFDDDDDFDVS